MIQDVKSLFLGVARVMLPLFCIVTLLLQAGVLFKYHY